MTSTPIPADAGSFITTPCAKICNGAGMGLVYIGGQRLMGDRVSLWVVPILKGVALGVVLLVAFVAGFFFHSSLFPAVADLALADPPEGYPLLQEVQGLLERYYLRELPEQRQLEYAAIRGVLGALNDPYTLFNDPPVTRNESDALAGQYGGIGVDVQYAADGSYVLYPYPDSPALEAGIEDGDILLAVNGQEIVPGTRLDEIIRALRGEVKEGNGVDVRVRKHTSGAETTYTVPFAVITVPSVTWRTLREDSRIGYAQVKSFTSRTPQELRQAFDGLLALEIEALILDLRNNAGGLLQEAIETADAILDEGVIVIEKTRDGEREYTAEEGGLDRDLPLIILVNQGTASAAELVAGALRDNGRAVLIGQRTYGKGSVQLIFPLSDGSSVHITSAEWLTPSRAPLNRQGLEPDISMIPAEDGRDVELDEAIRQLQPQIVE